MKENELNKKTTGSCEEQVQENKTVPELPVATESAIQLEELQKQLDQSKDLLLRKAAEFENYKRRVENEISGIIRFAAESLIADILPILDDFERSLRHSRETKDYDSIVKGIDLIYQKFIKLLENRGVRSFETVGKEFNVEFHDALMQVPRSDLPPHTVIEEVEKGYTLNDKVIRHAKVIVSTAVELQSDSVSK
jgi:molecular chaperone GrpE